MMLVITYVSESRPKVQGIMDLGLGYHWYCHCDSVAAAGAQTRRHTRSSLRISLLWYLSRFCKLTVWDKRLKRLLAEVTRSFLARVTKHPINQLSKQNPSIYHRFLGQGSVNIILDHTVPAVPVRNRWDSQLGKPAKTERHTNRRKPRGCPYTSSSPDRPPAPRMQDRFGSEPEKPVKPPHPSYAGRSVLPSMQLASQITTINGGLKQEYQGAIESLMVKEKIAAAATVSIEIIRSFV